jgi:drug/metabolite transporter (DMT)-like permease
MICALLGSISQGLGLVLAKKGMIHQGQYDLPPVHATWIRMGIGAGTTYIIGAFRSNLWFEFRNITFVKAHLKPVITGTLFGPVLGVSMSLLAAKNMEVSMAQTIFSLLPVSVMLTAHVSGKEKVSIASFIAAVISICGVVLLVWRNELFQ